MGNYTKIKKNDLVEVITGKDRGKSGKVIEIDHSRRKVIVEGLNKVKKTIKRTQKNQIGGIKEIEAFMDISNVMLICPKCKKKTRIGYIFDNNKNKKRICKKCKSEID